MKTDVEQALTGIEIAADGQSATARFCFPSDQAIFAGHFPGLPLVPGIYLIEIGQVVAEHLADIRLELVEVVDARFTARVGPEQTITATVKLSASSGEQNHECSEWRCDADLSLGEVNAGRLRLKLRASRPPALPAVENG